MIRYMALLLLYFLGLQRFAKVSSAKEEEDGRSEVIYYLSLSLPSKNMLLSLGASNIADFLETKTVFFSFRSSDQTTNLLQVLQRGT